MGKRAPDSSFPSGHTAGSFAAATVMSHFYPRWRIPLYAVALGVGLSRTYLGQHYPSDVGGGALIGTRWASLRWPEPPGPEVNPRIKLTGTSESLW